MEYYRFQVTVHQLNSDQSETERRSVKCVSPGTVGDAISLVDAEEMSLRTGTHVVGATRSDQTQGPAPTVVAFARISVAVFDGKRLTERMKYLETE